MSATLRGRVPDCGLQVTPSVSPTHLRGAALLRYLPPSILCCHRLASGFVHQAEIYYPLAALTYTCHFVSAGQSGLGWTFGSVFRRRRDIAAFLTSGLVTTSPLLHLACGLLDGVICLGHPFTFKLFQYSMKESGPS